MPVLNRDHWTFENMKSISHPYLVKLSASVTDKCYEMHCVEGLELAMPRLFVSEWDKNPTVPTMIYLN